MEMRDIGMDMDPGSGLAAAEEYYRSTAKPIDLMADKLAAM